MYDYASSNNYQIKKKEKAKESQSHVVDNLLADYQEFTVLQKTYFNVA